MRSTVLPLASFILLTVFVSVARGEPTRELYVEGRKEVFDGEPISTRLTAHARIRVGLRREVVIEGLNAAVTRLARGGDGALYVGTAGKGLLRWEDGAREPQALTSEGVITALAPAPGGVVFATADDGQIHRARGASVEPFVRIEARYVWDLGGRDGRLWAVTGEPGTLAEIREGRVDVRFEADERHLRSLEVVDDAVFFGGGERGIVYRRQDGGVRALHDSALDEVTDLAWDPDARALYAGSVSSETEASLPAFRWIGAVGADESDDSPFRGSELVRVDGDGRVDVLWRAQREGLLDLEVSRDGVVFSTGGAPKSRARLYRWTSTGGDRLELVARIEDALAPAFTRRDDGALLVGTGASGRLVQLGPAPASTGEYRSAEQDFQRVGRVGRLWFDADVPPGAQVALSLRTGNTSEVDGTWSDWSEPVTRARGGAIEVPEGRYAQFRLQLRAGSGGATPEVRSMHASVVRLNDPPQVHEVFPLQRAVALEPLPMDVDQDKTLTLSSSVLDKLRPRAMDDANGRQRVRQSHREGFRTVAWHASDTNGDELVYRVEMRAAGGSGWTELARDLAVPFWSFDSRAFPDGRYVYRVSASDRPSNNPRDALVTRVESAPVLIDNSPPELTELKARASADGSVEVEAKVRDENSPVVEAHVAVDGRPWLMMPAVDGLVDAREERLRVRLTPDEVGPSEAPDTVRIISVRAVDDAGNEVTGSVALRSP